MGEAGLNGARAGAVFNESPKRGFQVRRVRPAEFTHDLARKLDALFIMAMKASPYPVELEEVKARICSGELGLMLAIRDRDCIGLVVLEKLHFPGGLDTFGALLAASIETGWEHECMREWAKWAAELGCTQMMACGRKGWIKRWRKYGFVELGAIVGADVVMVAERL
jgi:hypothetical protein